MNFLNQKYFLGLKERVNTWTIEKLDFHSSQLKLKSKEINKFEDLTPLDNLSVEDYGEYFKTLEWALSNDKIKNIAVTGTYGSGKSSILRSFEKLYPNYEYLNISLASFSEDIDLDKVKKENVDQEETTDENQSGNNKSYLNRLIERSILQQIFYRVRPKDIPESRFKRIFSVSWEKTLSLSVLVVIWIFSTLETFNPDYLSKIELWESFNYRNTIIVDLILLTITIIGSITLLYKLFKVFKHLTFSRLNFIKGEIEIAKDIDKSILNNHLDEILYFFESQNYDVVIIEDIDRYDNVDIFTKLREINILINQSKQVGRTVRFIYAIRDELFDNIQENKGARTKFFDFIVPVIPVINATNSEVILAEKLQDEVKDKSISKKFLSDISLYIDDMRLLKNVCNEFFIYSDRLSSKYLDREKIFSMVLYKNLFPDDFSKLQLNDGHVYNAFNHLKKESLKKLNEENEEKIKVLQNKIKDAEADFLTSSRELRKLYLYELYRQASTQHNQAIKKVRIDSDRINIEELINENNFDRFRTSNNISTLNSGNGTIWNISSFQEIENKLDPKIGYEEREKALSDKSEKKLQKLKKELRYAENKRDEINKYTLENIFKELTPVEILGLEISENNLLVFLLRNGYIDEMYSFYVSYFYEGALKREDFNFILSLKNHNKLSSDFSLTKIDEIISRLHDWEFSQKEILNIDLVDHLLKNENKYKNQLQNLFKSLANEPKLSFDFIEDFINSKSPKIGHFIKLLCQNWHDIWGFIDNASNFDDEKKDKYLKLIIEHSDLHDVELIHRKSEGNLGEYIQDKSNLEGFCQGDNIFEKFKNTISALDLKFRNFTPTDSEHSLNILDFMYEKNLYELNQHMIALMLKSKCNFNEEKLDSFKIAPYSVLINSNCATIKSYANKNLQNFVEQAILKNESVTEENSYFIELLNNEKLSFKSKSELIVKQSSKIEKISDINDYELWPNIINQNKVSPYWINVGEYYGQSDEIDQILIDFISDEQNSNKLLSKKASKSIFKDFFIFSKGLISNSEIKTENKIRFITSQMDNFTREQIGSLLNILPYPYKKLNQPRNRPKFKITQINRELLNKLQQRTFITEFKEIDNRLKANVKAKIPGN